MGSQLSYCHSSNRLTTKPFLKIVFSGFHGQLKDRMDTTLQGHYNVWTRTEWRQDDVGGFPGGSDVQQEGVVNNPFPSQTYVYLTADSDYELETLKEDETYIIGGIVDKNRYKVIQKRRDDRLDAVLNLRSLTNRTCAGTRRTDSALKRLDCQSGPTSQRCQREKS